MVIPGYQCQQCWATFTDERTCDHPESDIECPTCHKTGVKRVEIPESWLDGTRNLCFG